MNKTINSRITVKHDITANWNKATNFKPLAGEIIVYDADETHPIPRIKIGNGDGVTNVCDLPFQPDKAIYDVTELPTANIDENNIYRLNVGHIYISGVKDPRFTCLIVDGLPESGQLQMIAETGDFMTDVTRGYCYYDLQTNNVYGYFTDQDVYSYGVYHGWVPFGNVYYWWSTRPWGGVILNANELPSDNKIYVALEYELYWYKGGWFSLTDHIGRHGTGEFAEAFNHHDNIASGDYSHAEGYGTTASGLGAHAEGHTTHAEGHASHAEGELAFANGEVSHAEGFNTRANGSYSHVEGIETIANGRGQHVQGRYNIEDNENKYAHIVGNGEDIEHRSNAHTVDWDGNAWFAGNITGHKVIIEDDIGNQTIVAAIADPKPEDNGKILKAQDGKWILAEDEAGSIDVVKYTEQTLTNEQQSQARKNIRAGQPILNAFGLSEQNVDSDTLYRIVDTIVYDYGELLYKPTFIYVEELPNTGKPIIDLNSDNDDFCFYFNNGNGLVYCYVDETLSAAAGADGIELESKWYDYQEFLYIFGDPGFGIVILAVDNLPNAGMPSLMFNQNGIPYGDVWGYYSQSDNEAYCYVDDNLSAFIYNQLGQSIPEGWYLLSQLAPMNDIYYQGIFTKEEDIPSEGVGILLINKLYSYNNQWEPIQKPQIQSNWEQDNEAQPDFIRNKPLYQGKIRPSLLYQPDWDIINEASPSAIKNKPFEYIGINTVIYDGYTECSYQDAGGFDVTTGNIVGTFAIKPKAGMHYRIQWGTYVYDNCISYEDGMIRHDAPMLIDLNSGTISAPYLSLAGAQPLKIIVSMDYVKQLDLKFLPIDTELLYGSTNLVLNGTVYNALYSLQMRFENTASEIQTNISNNILPQINTLMNSKPPNTTAADNGKLLQVVNGKPAWVTITNGNEVAY